MRSIVHGWIGVNAAYPSGNDQYPFGQVNSVREARIAQLAAKIVFSIILAAASLECSTRIRKPETRS